MAAEENVVRITQWPDQAAELLHSFNPAKPASVNIATVPQQPLQVEMAMQMSSRDPVKLCVSVCEPICAQSDYTIGIDIFDRPVASITVRGTTRLFNCSDKNIGIK
jgi:hypothetical protein